MRTLVVLFFLSSAACVSAKPSELKYAKAIGALDGGNGTKPRCGLVRRGIPRIYSSAKAFKEGVGPIRFTFFDPTCGPL